MATSVAVDLGPNAILERRDRDFSENDENGKESVCFRLCSDAVQSRFGIVCDKPSSYTFASRNSYIHTPRALIIIKIDLISR